MKRQEFGFDRTVKSHFFSLSRWGIGILTGYACRFIGSQVAIRYQMGCIIVINSARMVGSPVQCQVFYFRCQTDALMQEG
jgi:hypothetical protein